MYFVCETCNAKWFAETNVAPCPRCGTVRQSNINIKPPWESVLLTVKAVAERLNVSARMVYALAGRKLPCYRIGSALRFRLEDIDAYLESCRSRSATPTPERPTALRRLRI